MIPVGAWVRLELAGLDPVVAFTYVDPQAGFSAGGWALKDGALERSRRIIVRLGGAPWPWAALTAEEEASFDLEAQPSWVAQFYGPQPPAGMLWGWWRNHPDLLGKLHPEYPDDLQVLVHDGGPRLTDRRPELVWVRVTGGQDGVFRGRVLNQPHQLVSVAQGSEILFVKPAGGAHLLQVRERYLEERKVWGITPCKKCGLSELFDAPSDLQRVVFPNTPADAVSTMFTVRCGACGGFQVASRGQG
jgi:hypothetical protein